MKQSLQLRLGQSLTMTPQLQQAIRLLQLSTVDLQQEIQEILDSNLMLEQVDESEEQAQSTTADDKNEHQEQESKNTESEDTVEAVTTEPSTDTIPDELPVDSSWEDVYDGSTSYSAGADSNHDGQYESRRDHGENLYEHLLWQLDLTPFSEVDNAIALTLLDSIGEDGYLLAPVDEILQGLQQQGLEIEMDEVEAVLHRIQHFDPVGVAARSVGECLAVQLQQLPPDTCWLKEALQVVGQYLDALGRRDFTQIMRSLRLKEDELQQIIELIQTLNPRPGAMLAAPPSEYVVPDVLVTRVKGNWRVELNPDTLPRLRINNEYASLIRKVANKGENTTLKNHLHEARWFLKSLISRNDTLLKVATCIVERQRGFLDSGDEAMRPLVLRDVAEEVGMHESTVSRVTTQKYMHTPRGIFEFKYFFSSHVNTADGGECSATAIRAIIRKLIAAESPSKPLSDSKITDVLMGQGIKVARRTVAKYREAMLIASSSERKRLA